jgi:hypothetical protein
VGGLLDTYFKLNGTNVSGMTYTRSTAPLFTFNGTSIGTTSFRLIDNLVSTSKYYYMFKYISGSSNGVIETLNLTKNNQIIVTGKTTSEIVHTNGQQANNFNFELYFLNMTSLGIASVTQAQMDAYFQAWQRNNAGTLLANTFIQHDQNSVPIADLNGKTLDEVFINSNELELNTISPFFDRVSVDIQNDEMEINLLSISPSIAFSILSKTINSSTNQYYYSSSIKTPNNSQFRLFYSNLDVIVNTLSNQYTTFSGIYNNIASNSNLTFRFFSSNQTIGDKLYLKSTMFINLTALGITATKEQLDFWYSVWQQNHKLGMRVHRASGNDIPLAVLNNQSFNQVFVGGQLVDVNLFTFSAATNTSIIDGVISFTPTGQFGRTQRLFSFQTNVYYYRADIKTTKTQVYLALNAESASRTFTLGNNTFQPISRVYTSNGTSTQLEIVDPTTSGYTEIKVRNIHLIDLTSLGIATLTKSQLDYLYQVWQFNNLNALVARQFIQEA